MWDAVEILFIAKKAGLTELVEIETTRGGTPKKEMVEKYKLVHTHTARRTGATLMYLAGIDIYDIMKVTGHSSPKMLKKYIKADSSKSSRSSPTSTPTLNKNQIRLNRLTIFKITAQIISK